MIQETVARMVEGITAPRASTRRILDMGAGIETAVALVVAGYAIQAFVGVLFFEMLFPPPPSEEPAERLPALMFHTFSIVFQFLVLGFIVGAVTWIGRMFGGSGGVMDAVMGVAWYFLITSLLSPIFSYGFATIVAGEETGLSVLLLFVATGIALWVFANVVAELHRFESAWAVLGTMLALMIAASLIVTALSPGA